MTGSRLGPGPEFDRIRSIAAALGPLAGSIGDDCAVIPDGAGTLVASTDSSVEGVHFRLDWITLEEAGYRAAASALSDLAATGAHVTGLLAAISAPRSASAEELAALMRGVGSVLESTGGVVLGGDLTGGERWSATITVLGRAERVMRRNGARAGDGVWVTGRLGAARTAVQAWFSGTEPGPEARESFVRPIPRLAAGQWLAAHGATAMMDLSDGIAGDAGHLAAASNVRIEIELERVPVHPSVNAQEPALFAVAGGEDYELLVCLPGTFAGEQAAGVPLTRIGTVREGEGAHLLRRGQAAALPSSYNHFG